MNAPKKIATRTYAIRIAGTLGPVFEASEAFGAFRVLGALSATVVLAACTALPSAPPLAVQYDFGPGAMAAAPTAPRTPLPPLAWAEMETPGVPEGSTAVHYRLAYADAQQLRPYAQARWSQPPAQLVQQRLREQLAQRRAVLPGTVGGRHLVVRTELEEFSHVFTSPADSAGWVRLRATVVAAGETGDGVKGGLPVSPTSPAYPALRGQRVFVAQVPAPAPDAAGGAYALARATEAIARELDAWLDTLAPR